MRACLTQSLYITGVSAEFIQNLPNDDSVMKNSNSATIDVPKAVQLQNDALKQISTIVLSFNKHNADLIFLTTEDKDFVPLRA
jgi:hypothetical protein